MADAEGGEEQPTPATAQTDSDDFDTEPAERVDGFGQKKVNNIPHPRVKQMIAKRERTLIATVAKELGITKAEAELSIDDVLGSIKERGTKFTDYEGRVKEMDALDQIIASDPDRFMQMLVQANPGYAAYAKQQAKAAAAVAQAGPAAGEEDPEPQPDFDLGNGQFTFSINGLKKLREWERRQTVKEVEGKFADRYKPLEDKVKADAETAKAEKLRTEALTRVDQRLEKAKKWPQFNEHSEEILKTLQADKMLTLEDAYMHVVMPKLAGDRTKIRQEVLAEINGQPKSSSAAVAAAVPKADASKPKSTADHAREVLASFDK